MSESKYRMICFLLWLLIFKAWEPTTSESGFMQMMSAIEWAAPLLMVIANAFLCLREMNKEESP